MGVPDKKDMPLQASELVQSIQLRYKRKHI